MAIVQILVFAFLTLLAHNSWGYDASFICRGDRNCVLGYFECASCAAEGGGENSYLAYTVGQRIQVSGYAECYVTNVVGGFVEGCPTQGFCSDKSINIGCWLNPQSSSSSSVQSSSTTAPPDTPTTCQYCEDYVDYSSFPPIPKSRNWACTQCSTDSLTGATVANGCTVERDGDGSCEDNGDCPDGMICNDSLPNVDCYATVGSKVYLRDRKSGHVWGCDADGSCQMALSKYAQGQCQDPNPPPSPNSSDSGDNSSSSGEGISSEGGSSGSNGPWALESTLQLNTAYAKKTAEYTGDIANYTVTIMGKTSDIYNEIIEHGITLNNIKDNTDDINANTGATATNTGNINDKLTTTNSLLNDIKNKNWQPHIDVQPPEVTVNVQGDTNSVNVNVDTSRAPSEILNLLRNFFGSADTSSNYNPQDTAGAGEDETSMLDSIKAKVGSDTIPNMTDSIPNAVNGVKLKMRAFRDSVNNSAFGDSLTRWQNQLLNNGVITGNGSDNCPSLFTRTFTWNMGQKLGTWNIGKFQFICEPIQGVGVSLWQLARTLLRAIVAISCMLWLYKTVMGVEGANDED